MLVQHNAESASCDTYLGGAHAELNNTRTSLIVPGQISLSNLPCHLCHPSRERSDGRRPGWQYGLKPPDLFAHPSPSYFAAPPLYILCTLIPCTVVDCGLWQYGVGVAEEKTREKPGLPCQDLRPKTQGGWDARSDPSTGLARARSLMDEFFLAHLLSLLLVIDA